MVSYTKYFDIELFEAEISKHQYPWHFHNCYTLIMVERGTVIYEFHEKSVRLSEAEALIIEPYKIHRNTISKPTVYKAIFLPQEYFEPIIQNGFVTLKVKQQKGVDAMTDFFNNIKVNSSKEEIKEMVFKLSEIINCLHIPKNQACQKSANEIPEIDWDLTIDELAEKAHLSKFHFQRKFKEKCGLTVGQLKQQEKTFKAKALLENGKLCTDVALQLGFSDQSHFIKYFRKMWVITPKYFKK